MALEENFKKEADLQRDGNAWKGVSTPLLRWIFATCILLLVLAQPLSHVGLDRAWPDQSKFYQALMAALHGTPNILVDEGWVGPGYVGAAVIVNRIAGIRPEDTLVLLNRLSYIGTIALVIWFVIFRAQPGKREYERRELLSLTAGFVYLICVTQATGLTFFSDVPWSHFVASFLIVLTIALLSLAFHRQTRRAQAVLLVAAGLSLGLLAGVRMFDGIVVAVCLMIVYGIPAITRKKLQAFAAASTLMALGAVVMFALCLHLSGARHIPLFYLAIRIDPALKKIYLSTFFPKAFQLFVDPSFYTSPHAFTFRATVQKTWTPSFDDWKMPLLLQAPILLYALALVPVIAVGLFTRRNKEEISDSAPFRAMLMIAIVLLVGYTTTFVAGSPNLLGGMIRDYMPVIWCLIIIAAPTTYRWWYARPAPKLPWVLCGTCILVLLLGEGAAAYGIWPTYTSRQIARAIVTPTCRAGECELAVAFVSPRGDKWAETKDMIMASINCAGNQEPVVLVGPSYRFHECPGAIDGTILPRLAGLAAQNLDNVPFSFTFRLPGTGLGTAVDSRTYLFGTGTATHSLLIKGWSANEAGFVWSDGKLAQISIPVRPFKSGDLVDVDMEVAPFLVGSLTQQHVVVSIDGRPPQPFLLYKNVEHLRFSRIAVGEGDLKVVFSLPDATTPRSLGISSDSRTLAIELRRITFSARGKDS